jgi:hypothetical protein
VRAGALAVLARALLGSGRAAEASAAAGESVGLIDLETGFDEFALLANLTRAEVLLAEGEAPRAAKALAAIRTKLESIASGFRDAGDRERFVHAHPYHQRALRLAGAAGV